MHYGRITSATDGTLQTYLFERNRYSLQNMLDYLNKMSVGLWRSFLMVKEVFVPGENHTMA